MGRRFLCGSFLNITVRQVAQRVPESSSFSSSIIKLDRMIAGMMNGKKDKSDEGQTEIRQNRKKAAAPEDEACLTASQGRVGSNKNFHRITDI